MNLPPDRFRSALLLALLLALACAAPIARASEPLALVAPQATFFAGGAGNFACVVDGVEIGPSGWSVAVGTTEAQSLVVACAQPVEASELDIALFFLAGKPFNPMAEFALFFTTDEKPSFQGKWQPLEILRFNSQAATLQRVSASGLRANPMSLNINGAIPDEIYRVTTVLPGGRATGFRLDAIPVPIPAFGGQPGLSWHHPFDFTLTEFRVAIHVRETTNIALYRPVKSSHPLYLNPDRTRMRPEALTDGLPATIAHPDKLPPGDFHFEIDLGQVTDFDHIGLRNRGDEEFERFSRVKVALYDTPPAEGGKPLWQGMARADGSHPPPGAVEVLRASDGQGDFRGRFLRVSTDSPVPYAPQLAEVEVYQTRTPEVVSALADGHPLPVAGGLEIPPGVKRLSLQVRIPQIGRPVGDAFRWRVRGDMEHWQSASAMPIDMACPPPGHTVFEAQALHSDRSWDASLYQLPILTRQHFWRTTWFRSLAGTGMALLAIGLGILWSRRRAARQMARMQAEAALASERARIARDMHDEVGGKLARLSMLGNLILNGHTPSTEAKPQLSALTRGVREVAAELEQVIWSLNPKHDRVENLIRHIYQYAEEFFADTPVRCRFGPMSDISADSALRPQIRSALFRSFKEAVANVLKHARASAVEIDVSFAGGMLAIRIADNGRGFDPDTPPGGEHNGLTNMRDRMAEIGGSCSIRGKAAPPCCAAQAVCVTAWPCLLCRTTRFP